MRFCRVDINKHVILKLYTTTGQDEEQDDLHTPNRLHTLSIT